MLTVCRNYCACLMLLTVALCAAGCRTAGWWNPFYPHDPAEKLYGKTPAERMTELEQTAAQMPRMTPEGKIAASGKMREIVQNELDPQFREVALRALGPIQSPDADAALRLGLRDADVRVRIAACQTLAERRDSTSMEMLTSTLKNDGNIDVRLAAAKSLGMYKDPVAMKALGEALSDRDPALQHRAVESLKLVSGKDYQGDLVAWRELANGGQPAEPKPAFAANPFNWFR